MDITQLVIAGMVMFGVGMVIMKNKKRMTPEERATYDATYALAKKEALVEKAAADAVTDVKSGGGLGGALAGIGSAFAGFQEEGGKLNLPSLMDYDKEDDGR